VAASHRWFLAVSSGSVDAGPTTPAFCASAFPFREGVAARADGVVQRWDRRKTKAESRKLKTEIISAFQFPLTLNYPVRIRGHPFTEGEFIYPPGVFRA
jgi:hypothetical protein